MNKIYEIVTEQIIKALEKGSIPWKKPFFGHQNLVSRKEYRGVNVLLLGATDYPSPFWVTYKQAGDLGGHVKKGETSTLITFWKMLKRTKDDDGAEAGEISTKDKFFPMLRYFRVFNATQCEGLDVPALTGKAHNPIEACEAVIRNLKSPPAITHSAGRAVYRPEADTIALPEMAGFESPEAYYATLFHELVHSTGHKSRLDRLKMDRFGSEGYAREELVAEIGAAFLCQRCGILPAEPENTAAYIQSWLKALDNDKKLIVVAAAQAQKAVDYLLAETTAETETAQEAEAA